MNLLFDRGLAVSYKSPSQRIRVLTEQWTNNNIYCPSCGSPINKYQNNQPVADFHCTACKEQYELKSKRDNIGYKVLDGAYKTMLERLRSSYNPNFFFLSYDLGALEVLNFKVFLLDEMYSFEKDLKLKHPDNKHIKDKIRQQLQFLRDKGYLEFLGKGKYKIN